MSAFKQRMAKLGVRAGLLAGASAAVLAISGIGASSALAAPTCVTSTLDLQGKGASLQKIAQEAWTGREANVAGVPHPVTSGGYAAACNEATKATVSYTSTGSGPGLEAFGFTGGALDKTMAYIGTDDAPTELEITSAETTSGAKALIIPVAQTAIAVIVHPPAGCTLTWTNVKGLTYKQLTQIFGGSGIKKWSELTNDSGTCESEITRVVRSEGSGTTYQFKNYLAVLQAKFGGVGMPCNLAGFDESTGLPVAETKEWAKMKAIKTGGEPNTLWPKPANCAGTTPVEAKAGGSGVVKYVDATAGTIGYASLPDAKLAANTPNGKVQLATLQSAEESEEAVFGSPAATMGEKSNCGTRVYTVPKPGRVGESGESVDWSKTFGAEPEVGAGVYPLCTLTFDAAWNGYEAAGYASPTETAETIKDYIEKYVLEAGQSIGKWYQPLPETLGAENNVLGAAKLAASKIKK